MENNVEVCAVLPNFSTFKDLFDLDTYYQYGYVNGKQYKLYNVIVTDKEGKSSLNYTKKDSIILCGGVTNENQAKQLDVDAVKFVGTAIVAATTVSSPWLGFALSTLISMIPNYKSEDLIHGKNVVTVDSFTVDEIVRYVYGYDEVNDKWILIHSANRAVVTYLTVMHFRKNAITDLVSKTSRTYMDLEALSVTNDFLAQYLVRAIQNPHTFSILDKIYSNITMELDSTSGFKHTFPLHGTSEPYRLY